MLSQTSPCDNYKELLKFLTDLHPELDNKLLQYEYDDNFDILLAVYLKVTLNSLS